MRAIEVTKLGKPDVLKLTQRPVPQITEYEVLIRVHTAGVNRPDIMQRAGLYPPPPGVTDIPGLEVSGLIVAIGKHVTQWKIGDPICALVAGGGYAEYVSAPATQCLPIPKGLSLREAASLPETYFTVWSNVFDRAGLCGQETILVHGGSSGIGTTAIQLCRAFGHEIFVTAGSDEKCHACETIGATKAINYNDEDFVERVMALTNDRGVDIIIDMVAGDYLQRNLRCLADDGRIVIIAFLGGVKTNLNMTDILKRRLTVTGSTLRPRATSFKANIAESLAKKVWPLLEKKIIKPLIFASFSLEDAAEAHRLMESSQHIGKIILDVRTDQ
ncbi:MAG: NAD(P)H-quinone oxidoreductase [Proteobacteria bacterium]|nr:NAD(P)H-quinone oxidoreductase [Pseudomonadota bacterium]MDA1011445.1 NAD(P)H-quinone oxidoreductase [Pseudomonadota bacterium]